jgi:sterol O-acyltransferase
LKAALEAVARTPSSEASSQTGSEEDYDTLERDPGTVVHGGKGGGLISHEIRGANSEMKEEKSKVSSSSRPNISRLRSISVTLNKLSDHGRYLLTADDDALREILRTGMERV